MVSGYLIWYCHRKRNVPESKWSSSKTCTTLVFMATVRTENTTKKQEIHQMLCSPSVSSHQNLEFYHHRYLFRITRQPQ